MDASTVMLTVGSVLTTSVSQTNLYVSFCSVATTLKVRLGSSLSLLLEWTTLTANAHF